MWLNQSQDSLCFIELSVVVDTPFNERLCALFRSLSGVPEHSSHTCCSRHTYPDLIIMFYLHGCQTMTKSSYSTCGYSVLIFIYLDWMFIDWMYFLRETLFFNPKISKKYTCCCLNIIRLLKNLWKNSGCIKNWYFLVIRLD